MNPTTEATTDPATETKTAVGLTALHAPGDAGWDEARAAWNLAPTGSSTSAAGASWPPRWPTRDHSGQKLRFSSASAGSRGAQFLRYEAGLCALLIFAIVMF